MSIQHQPDILHQNSFFLLQTHHVIENKGRVGNFIFQEVKASKLFREREREERSAHSDYIEILL